MNPIPVTEALDSAWNEIEAARQAYERAITHLTNVRVKDFPRTLVESLSATVLMLGADQRLAETYRKELS